MAEPITRSRSDIRWAMIVGAMIGLGGGLLLCQVVHAQSLWPTPEIHGTVRDLTHLPQLPLFPMQPDNLQHQMWSQPGVGVVHRYRGAWIDGPYSSRPRIESVDPAIVPQGTQQLFQKIISDFERHKIQ